MVQGFGRAAWIAGVLFSALVFPCGRDAAASRWTAGFLLGGAWNADSRLRIEQGDFPEIDFDAKWETRPFDQPLYWALRFGQEKGRRGWALELMHHKIYLRNPPPDVQSFSISHGLNYLTLQRAWLRERWHALVAIGLTAAHRENTIRDRRLAETGGAFGGYEITGPVLGVGIGSEIALGSSASLVGEVRIVHSWFRVDVVDGLAKGRNLALHLLFGPRFGTGAP